MSSRYIFNVCKKPQDGEDEIDEVDLIDILVEETLQDNFDSSSLETMESSMAMAGLMESDVNTLMK